jgi:hypothetical protein
MLHPALARAPVAAHIEDLQRAAVRMRTTSLARRVVYEPWVTATSIAERRFVDCATWTARAQTRGTARTESSHVARSPRQSVLDVRLETRAGTDRASREARPASSLRRILREPE